MIPKLSNRNILQLLLLSLFVIIGGIGILAVHINDYRGVVIINIGLMIGQIAGLILLVQNGSVQKYKYWSYFQFFFAIVLIGILFEALEWPGSSFLLLIPFTGIVAVYILRFMEKKNKKLLDLLKFVWMLTAYCCLLLMKLHLIPKESLFIAHGLFLLTILNFITVNYKTKKLF